MISQIMKFGRDSKDDSGNEGGRPPEVTFGLTVSAPTNLRSVSAGRITEFIGK